MSKYLVILLAVLLSVHFYATNALAHGVIGKRFIPSTLTLEDPFPSDEMDLLTFDRAPKDKEGRETSFGFEFGNISSSIRGKPASATLRVQAIRSFPSSMLCLEASSMKAY